MKSLLLAAGNLLLALSVGASRAAAQEEAPTDALVLYSAGLRDILEDPLDKGLRTAVRSLTTKTLRSAALEEDGPQAVLAGWLGEVLTRPLTLRISPPREETPLRARFVVEVADVEIAREWAQMMDTLLEEWGVRFRTEDPSGMTMTRTPAGSLFFGIDRGHPSPNLTVALGERLADDFVLGDTGLPEGVETKFFLRVDGRRLTEPLAFALDLLDQGPEVLQALQFLGWVGNTANACTWAFGYEEEDAVAVTRTADFLPRGKSGAFYTDHRLQPEDFEMVPADATLARVFGVNPKAFFSTFDLFETGAGDLARAELSRLSGVDLQDHLFEHLGNIGAYYWAESTGGGGLLSGVVLFRVANEERVDAALLRLTQVAERWAMESADGRFQSRSWSAGDVPCYSLAFPGLPLPVEVSYAIEGGWLVIAASPGTLRAALAQQERETTLLDHDDFPKSIARDLGALTGMSFFDAESFVRQGYGTASLVANAIANASRVPADPTIEPGEILPMYAEALERAGVWTSLERIQGKDRVVTTHFERSWVVNAATMLGTPLSLTLTAPFAAGFFGSMIEGFEEARRAANQRRIAWGLDLCRSALDEHKTRVGGAYPMALEDLVRPDAPERASFPGGMLPIDPWGQPFVYERSPFREDQARLGCLGKDGAKGGEGEDADTWIQLGSTSS